MPLPNDQLRQARECMPSPDDPTRHLSRAELTRLVNDVLFGADVERISHSAFNANYLGKLERGVIRWPLHDYRRALRIVLGASSDEELGFCRPDNRPAPVSGPPFPTTPEPLFPSDDADRGGPLRRRTLMMGGAGVAGLGAVALPDALESTRRGLRLAFAEDRAAAEADEWGEIVYEHSQRVLVTPSGAHLEALHRDLLAVRLAVEQRLPGADARPACRTAAMLGAFSAMTVGNLGDLNQSVRWWRTAKRFAAQSTDPATVVLVRAWEVVRALYDRRPAATIRDLIAQAEAIASTTGPGPGTAELLAGKAQFLALAGRGKEAIATLHQVFEIAERLPAEITSDRTSALGWPPNRAFYTASFVYSYLGNCAKAEVAQDAALRDYPPGLRRGPAQIELQRARCLVTLGDIAGGLRHAQLILTQLPPGDYTRPVVDLAHRVLEAIPASGRNRKEPNAYREFLRETLTAGQNSQSASERG